MRLFIPWLLMASLAAGDPPDTALLPTPGPEPVSVPRRGTGLLRWKRLVKLYHASLYLDPTASDPVAATPKRLRMDYLRDFTREDMVRATNETIGRGQDAATCAAIAPALATWNALYPAIHAGDAIEFDHLTGGMVTMRHNGMALGAVTDEAFARALFAIWIGPQAVDAGLRSAMTGAP